MYVEINDCAFSMSNVYVLEPTTLYFFGTLYSLNGMKEFSLFCADFYPNLSYSIQGEINLRPTQRFHTA